MKNNKKSRNRKVMLLSILSLVAVVGGAVGGTAAWFIANRTATGTWGQMSAAVTGDLEVRGAEDAWGHTYVTVEGQTLTDISGDGVTFFKPIFGPNPTDASGSNGVTSVNEVTESTGYYLTTTLEFRSRVALTVYLNSSSDITATSATTGLVAAIRAAFVIDDAAVAYFKKGGTATTYVDSTDVTNGAVHTANLDMTKMIEKSTMVNPTLTSQDGTNNPALFTFAGEQNAEGYYTQTMTINMWIEGMDSAAVVANINDTITASLNFFALNRAEENLVQP